MTSAREFIPSDAFGRRRLKVAFVGTHGVGKTTLCFDLAAQLKRLDLGVDLVKEVARRCPLPINEATTPDAQAWILHTQIAEELEVAQTTVVFHLKNLFRKTETNRQADLVRVLLSVPLRTTGD